MSRTASALILGALLATACTDAPDTTAARETPPTETVAPAVREAMVNTANPHATRAGAEMLRAGGSAVDAAIAAHLVLGLVEPQSSGIGGGGFMLVHDGPAGETEVIDGRETAPAGATLEMFLGEDGEALSHKDRIQSGHSVGVPGAIALYWTAHQRHGLLPWAELFGPAIELAESGFEVSPRLHGLLVRMAGYTDIEEHADTAAYFFPDGEALPVGHLLQNPAYAETLRGVAERGPEAFYTGSVAEAIAARAQQPPRPGTLTVADITGYEAKVREPVCGPFRSYTVCSAPPPSSGVAVVEIMGLLERFAPDGASDDVDGWSAFVDAQLLAYADRDHYVADGDFVDVPVADLIDPAYLDARAADRPAPGTAPAAGDPGAVLRDAPIIDRWGRDGTSPWSIRRATRSPSRPPWSSSSGPSAWPRASCSTTSSRTSRAARPSAESRSRTRSRPASGRARP
jgi:gamma-glutamyltranspeptidase/glutathione hydrolase